MAKLIASVLLIASVASAQDAVTILAKARAAFLENRERERFWNWTTVTERSITDKNRNVLDKLPSTTVESPIRGDGKRCNALLAWGDGVEPYLSTATPEERCAVQEENGHLFREEAFLASRRVKLQSQTASAITLSISEDKERMHDPDAAVRCLASVYGIVRIDPASYFPFEIELNMPTSNCLRRLDSVANHYDEAELKNINNGETKGTTVSEHYELQKDKAGDRSKDFWICARRHGVRPLEKNAQLFIVSGRQFPLTPASDRKIIVDSRTFATELAAESLIKFETEKEK
jgi:hypothetical protein